MSGRGRGPRAGLLPKDDVDSHEESLYWGKIVSELRSLHSQSIKVDNLSSKIALEDKLDEDVEATIQDLQRVYSLYDDWLTLVEGVEKQLAAVLEDTNILIALRTATEGGDRATETKRTKKRKAGDDSLTDPITYSRTKMARSNSAAPSANNSGVGTPGGSGGAGGGGGSGSGSVGKDRDRDTASVTGGTGGEESIARRKKFHKDTSAASTSNSTSVYDAYPTDPSDPSLLQLGREVAYRLPKQKGAEGEWIQCIIVEITGEGPKRRYAVQDPEPDEAGGHGQIYRAYASALIPIPKESTGLPTYPVGKQVLARYPETTTFYRAEVMGTKRDGTCRLKFEGEEEVGKETEVERRLVLDFAGR